MQRRASDQIDLTKVVDGKDGTSVTILGSYNTMAELETAHPTGNLGDAYMVSGDLVVWNGSVWENVGRIQGPQGPAGRGISNITEYYAINNSTTAPADSAFDTTVKTPTATNRYLWNYELITYTDSTSKKMDKHIVAVYGEQGQTGKGISSVTEYYAKNNSTTAPADSAFDTSVVTADSSNKYVWNYELITYTDNTTSKTSKRIIGMYGETGPQGGPGPAGSDGISVTSVQPQYYLSTSSASATGGSWGTTITYVSGKYIWTRSKNTYSDGSVDYSTEIYNEALTQACQNALAALATAQAVNQYTWHTETDTGAGAGTHNTAIPKDDFLADPANGGYNSLFDNIGMKIRNGLRTLARFGLTMVIGEDDGARVEVDSDTIRGLTEDGAEAFSIETSAQESPQNVTKTLENKVPKNSTQTITLSDLSTGVAGTTIRLSYSYYYYYQGMAYGPAKGVSAVRNFTKGTAATYTGTYTENATGTSVTRTYTIEYDGVNSFTITNPSPYFTFDLTRVQFTSQNAPTPTTNFNGLFSINGVNFEQPVLDTTTIVPYSNRCNIIDGGIWRFGKWRFIQINVQINDITLGANNTWAILDGLANDLPATNGRDTSNNLVKMANLSASAQKNAGDISAYINGKGRIVVATSDQALTVNNVVMISGFYIAE